MDLIVSAITLQFNRANRHLKYTAFLLLTFTMFAGNAFAQKKAKKNVVPISAENKEKMDTYFFEGIRQKNVDNNEAAIRNFKNVIGIDPNNDAAYYELGLQYAKTKDYRNAAISFGLAYQLNAENEWYAQNYAKSLEDYGSYEKAEEIYTDIIKNNPEKIDIYFDLASVKIYRNDLKGANKIYSEIEKKIGVNEDVSMQKQKIWLKLGNVDKAAEEAKKLVDMQPTEMRFRMNLAEIYLSNKKLDKAEKVLSDIMTLEPNNGFAQLALADFYREKKDDKKSYEFLKKAFANPSLSIDQKVRILTPYFSLLSVAEVREKASELSKLATEAHPNEAKAFAIYGDFLFQDKQLEQAKEAYQKTISLDKKVFAVWQNLMFIQAELLDYKSLLTTSDEAIQLFPAQQVVHYLNAIAKMQTKDYEGAITSYKNAITLGAMNPELEAQIYSGMGDAYHSLKQHQESDEAYDKALKIKADEPFVLNNYAYYLSLRNIDLEKALSMSKKSNDLMKDNASFLDTYAWILFRLARYEEALVWIDKAITAGGSKSATVIEHRGDVLIMLKRTEEAIEEWNKALKMGEPSELLKKKITDRKYYE